MFRIILFLYMVFLPLTIVLFDIGGVIITPYYVLAPTIAFLFLFMRYKLDDIGKIIVFASFFIIISSLLSPLKISSLFHFMLYVFTSVMAMSMLGTIDEKIVKVNSTILIVLGVDVIIAFIFYHIGVDNVFTKLFFPYQIDITNSVRFASFTSEPSYLAFILSICMACLIFLKDYVNHVNIRWYFVIYVASIIVAKTTFGFLLLLVVFMYAIYKGILFKSNIPKPALIILSIIAFVTLFVILSVSLDNNMYFERLMSAFRLLYGSGSIEGFATNLAKTDGSASLRIVPSVRYFSTMNWIDIHTWIGHGFGSDSAFFSSFIMGNKSEIESLQLGYFPAAFYNFGLIGASVLLYAIIKIVKKTPAVFGAIFALSIFNCNVATQLFWFIVIECCWLTQYQYNRAAQLKIKKVKYRIFVRKLARKQKSVQ